MSIVSFPRPSGVAALGIASLSVLALACAPSAAGAAYAAYEGYWSQGLLACGASLHGVNRFTGYWEFAVAFYGACPAVGVGVDSCYVPDVLGRPEGIGICTLTGASLEVSSSCWRYWAPAQSVDRSACGSVIVV